MDTHTDEQIKLGKASAQRADALKTLHTIGILKSHQKATKI